MRNITRWAVIRGGKQDQVILKSKWDSMGFKSRRYSEPSGAQVRMASKNTGRKLPHTTTTSNEAPLIPSKGGYCLVTIIKGLSNCRRYQKQ